MTKQDVSFLSLYEIWEHACISLCCEKTLLCLKHHSNWFEVCRTSSVLQLEQKWLLFSSDHKKQENCLFVNTDGHNNSFWSLKQKTDIANSMPLYASGAIKTTSYVKHIRCCLLVECKRILIRHGTLCNNNNGLWGYHVFHYYRNYYYDDYSYDHN